MDKLSKIIVGSDGDEYGILSINPTSSTNFLASVVTRILLCPEECWY